MNYPQKQLDEAARLVQTSIRKVPSAEGDNIRKQTIEKFIHNDKTFLWEHLGESFAVHNPESWRWIGEFVGDTEVIMFFDTNNTTTVYSFENGSQIASILEQSSFADFYITNRQTDYLFCFNHHDYLIACGIAKDWLVRKSSDSRMWNAAKGDGL